MDGIYTEQVRVGAAGMRDLHFSERAPLQRSDSLASVQVAMGYAHSLVIARDENEAEKEKLKKLPEYNPRTL